MKKALFFHYAVFLKLDKKNKNGFFISFFIF
jgi:hypothetical protein